MKTHMVWIIMACMAASQAVRADRIKLVDGRSFEGTVVARDATYTVHSNDTWYQFESHQVQELNDEVISPVIRLTTGKGDMLISLFEDQAPNTVANMITLAEDGFYKDMIFHRIIPGFMAQGGCPHSKEGARGQPGTGGPGYRFADETQTDLKHDRPGILSMANSGPDTNGSQFFLCFKEAPHLDGRHTVFGRVVSGMSVLDQLEAIGSNSGTPTEKVAFDIAVVAKRNHPYEVRKIEAEDVAEEDTPENSQ